MEMSSSEARVEYAARGMPPDAHDALKKEVQDLQTAIEEAVKRGNNVTSNVSQELRALGDIWKTCGLGWAARGDERGRQSFLQAIQKAKIAVRHAESASGAGPQMNVELPSVRAEVAGATALILLLGVKVLNREEQVIAKLEVESSKALAEWAQKHRELDGAIAKSLESAKQASEQAASAAKQVGLGVKMTEFATARDAHRSGARAWAALGVMTALALLGLVARSIAMNEQPPWPRDAWHMAANLSFYLPRALVVSVLSWFMVFCARNFRAAKHNEIVNGHRAGALATYERLAKAPGDTVAEALTLYVAEAAFGVQPSGYSDAKAEGNHLSELVGALRSSKE
jgi:hypothetical protein